MKTLRLLIAEWLLDRVLLIMPKSKEQQELAGFLIEYMQKRIKEKRHSI